VAPRLPAQSPDQGKVTILVVDDEASILELLGEYLSARGHQVLTASDGQRALAVMAETTPDVVLSDLKMPGMSGLELLTSIRERPVPIATILMTGYGTIDSAIRSMKDGAHDYLLKPFKLREVHAAITRAVDRIRLERETVRLRQVVALYQAVHALRAPEGLADIYALLCELAQLEFGGAGTLIAFREHHAGEWVEYHRTARAPFAGLDLQTLGERLQEPGAHKDCWFGDAPRPLLVAPVRAQVSADASPRIVGLVAIAEARFDSSEAAQALEVYGSIVGDALSRQILASRLRGPSNGGAGQLGGVLSDGPEAHALRVGELVSATAEAAGMSPDQVQIASAAARIHDHGRLGVSLGDLLGGADVESLSLGERSVPPERVAELNPILVELSEHYDGHGSPRGTAGNAIHPIAQLIAVANAWDMLTRARAYAPLLSPADAAAALRAETGTVYRADVVDSFLGVVTRGD
jgi:response regulator RpfG family c-di-GMP phosphodiesterase